MNPEIGEIYGNKVRIRVSGLCWREDSLLMVKHRFGNRDFWAPPGGGIEFGEGVESALKREFREETGLEILPQKFLFGCEFLKEPLHAIELFFAVSTHSGKLKTGYDPEIQIIEEAKFLTENEIKTIPEGSIHGIFTKFRDVNILRQLSGFYSI